MGPEPLAVRRVRVSPLVSAASWPTEPSSRISEGRIGTSGGLWGPLWCANHDAGETRVNYGGTRYTAVALHRAACVFVRV